MAQPYKDRKHNQLAPARNRPSDVTRVDLRHLEPLADPTIVQVTAWREICKTIRYAVIGLTFVTAVGLMTWGVVMINAKDAPWWKVLFLVGAPPTSLVGMAILLLKPKITKFIDELSSRNRDLEKNKDPNRDSSGLLKDGTLPNDDK